MPVLAQGVVAIAAGYYHNLALLSDHTVVAWGLQNTVPAAATNVVAIVRRLVAQPRAAGRRVGCRVG